MGLQNTLKALADPIRREILNLLKNGRMSAGEIGDKFPVTGVSISRHLSVLDETLFTIEAAYWEDATVNYEDIENIEYREQVDRGTRNLGYGTPWLVIRQCENSEFGKYTGYMYTSCDDYVVLKVDGKLLVVNGKDEEDTKAIYEELLDRMRE